LFRHILEFVELLILAETRGGKLAILVPVGGRDGDLASEFWTANADVNIKIDISRLRPSFCSTSFTNVIQIWSGPR
jgi:hypothetical protein